MLLELGIKNFAVIENINISFTKGLNILTGETGAGKSIIVDSIELLLGERASSDIIRTGASETVLEAAFTADKELLSMLSEMGIPESDEIVIRRVISRDGKNKLYINGAIFNLSMLSKIRGYLVDIHGQHENQSLLSEEIHIDILDKFGELTPLLTELNSQYNDSKKLLAELELLSERDKKIKESQELLQFQLKEFTLAKLKENEDEILEAERKILLNSEKIYQKLSMAFNLLYQDSSSVMERLRTVLKNLNDVSNLDSRISDLYSNLENSLYNIDDSSSTLRDYISKMDFDPKRVDDIEERLFLLSDLKRKYGHTLSDVIQYKSKIEKELTEIDSVSSLYHIKKEEFLILQDKLTQCADKLSNDRVKIGKIFEKKVASELESIGMKNTRFIVDITERAGDNKIGQKGKDKIRFLISTNPGEEPRSLSKIASGGELSRIMLGLRRVLLGKAPIPTIVFDEIDQGIGGGQAEIVGRKLKDVAACHQVICITHLPQIASFGESHFTVEKAAENSKTSVTVERLASEKRVDEISRMISGQKISEKTRAVAKEMIRNARNI